ncbi:unnamed protein product, partial [Linum tenue]
AAAFSGFDGARLSRSRSSPTCTSARLPGPTGARPKTPIPSGSCPTFLDAEKPANNVPIANASSYWGQATSPARQRGIPWASVFGNHDDMPFEWPIEWFSGPGIPEGTTMDWTGAALMRSSGCATPGIPAMAGMGTGPEEPEWWRQLESKTSLSSRG